MHPTKALSLREGKQLWDKIENPYRWDEERIRQEATALVQFMAEGNEWLQDYALSQGYSPTIIYEWAKEGKGGMDKALEIAQRMQESTILKAGLRKEMDSSLVKLILSNRHGWQERQQVEHVGLPPMQVVHFGDPETAKPYHSETIDVTPQAISTAASPTPQPIVDVASNPLAV